MSLRHTTAQDLAIALHRFDHEAQLNRVKTPRYVLQYSTWGPETGTALVFVHGLCDQMRSFALMMSNLVDRGYRCIGYQLADGRNDQARITRYQHRDYAHDLVFLLDHLGLSKTAIFGSSFGSTVTLRSLAEYPQRFSKAIIQGGFARRPLITAERVLALVGRYWPWLMGQLPLRPKIMEKLEKPQFVGCDDDVFRYLLKSSGATPIKTAAYRALLLHKLDLRPLLPNIPHPLLMIGGDIDNIVPRNWEAEVEAGVKDVRRIEFQPCGHYPQYTLPQESCDAVDEFLKS
jgi:pimeloyl-ACP methyl ester carboxylesterase